MVLKFEAETGLDLILTAPLMMMTTMMTMTMTIYMV
jgi:hypothetical protein